VATRSAKHLDEPTYTVGAEAFYRQLDVALGIRQPYVLMIKAMP